MSDYTPTTRGVTAYYCYARQEGTGVTVEEGTHERFHAEFDRWLAEVERAAAEKAWDEGYWQGINGYTGPGNPHRDDSDIANRKDVQ